jgi:hypothetical protein
MPTIPTYDGPQVRQAALEGGFQQNQDISSGRLGVAKALQGAGDALDKLDQQRATLQAQEAEVKIRQAWYETDTRLRKEFSGTKIGGYQAAVDKWWNEDAKTLGEGLDGRAQMIASRSLVAARDIATRTTSNYAQAETARVEEVGHAAAKNAVIQSALTAVKDGDVQAAPMAATDIRAKNARWGELRNLSADEVAYHNVKDLTTLHSNVISQLSETNPVAARAYWDKLDKGKEFDATRVDEVDKLLKQATGQHNAQSFGDEVMAKKMTLEDALAEARKRFDGKDEEMALAEVKTRFTEQEAIQSRQAKAVEKQGWSILMEKGSMSAIPPSLMVTLREQAPEAERQMRDWLAAKARQAKADAEGKSDPDEFGRYYTYRVMAMEDPQKFSKLNLTQAQPYVSKQQLNHLVELQGGIERSDAKAMDLNTQVKTAVSSVKTAILASGLDMTPKEGSAAATEYNNFMGSVTMAISEAQRAAGDKPLPPEKLKAIGMDMLRVKYEQGSGIFGAFRSTKKGYQVVADPNSANKNFVDTPYGEIPEAIRNQLEADAPGPKTTGMYGTKRIDKEAIERAYQRGREQGRFK